MTPSRCATTSSAPSATRPLTGKPVGDDLREGKPTPLLARAMALADAGQRRAARSGRLRRGSTTPRSPAIQDVIVATGALDALEARIAELAAEAVAALDEVDITAEARCRLTELAAFVVARVL